MSEPPFEASVPPKFPPRVETPNLILRRYAEVDAPVLLEAISRERARLGDILADPVLALRTAGDAGTLIERLSADWDASHQFVIPLWHRAEGTLVGECYLGSFARDAREAEIGIFLLHSYEGRRLALEALGACVGAARMTMGLHLLHYRCDRDNLQSCALALRCGFSDTGEALLTRIRRDGSTVSVRHFTLDLLAGSGHPP
jgi:RimJ/RimL family protein N-acetyltransferase